MKYETLHINKSVFNRQTLNHIHMINTKYSISRYRYNNYENK